MLTFETAVSGMQTKTHCSATSSIGACERLATNSERCLLFKVKLEYDWDTHAYKRCQKCLVKALRVTE